MKRGSVYTRLAHNRIHEVLYHYTSENGSSIDIRFECYERMMKLPIPRIKHSIELYFGRRFYNDR